MTFPAALTSLRRRAEPFARAHPVALVALGAFLYSTSPVMVAASSVSGTVFAFWRLLAGVIVFGAMVAVRRLMGGTVLPRRAWRWALVSGLVFGTHQLLYFSAVKATSVVDVSLISRLSPLIVGVAAVRLFDERPGRSFVFGALIAVAGAVAVVLAGSSGPEGDGVGMTMAVGNVVAFSIWFLISKASRSEIDVPRLFFGTFAVSLMMVAIFVAVTGAAMEVPPGGDFVWIVGVAVIPGTLGHIASTWPLRWVPANIPPVLQLTLPILAGTMAWVLLGERVTGAVALGGIITLIGVGIAVLGRSGRTLVAEAKAKANPHSVSGDGRSTS